MAYLPPLREVREDSDASSITIQTIGSRYEDMKTPKTVDVVEHIVSQGTTSSEIVGAVSCDGLESEFRINYRSMQWWRAGALMVAETISLGILSLPHALKTLGLVPGLIVIVFFGMIATYTGYLYGEFSNRHDLPKDVGEIATILFGRWAGKLIGTSACVVLIFIAAAHITSFGIGLNVLSDHATCTIAFMGVGALLSFICCIPRTFHDLAMPAIISFVSIATATVITMSSIAIIKPSPGRIALFENPDPTDAVIAILDVILAYAGHIAFPSFVAELKQPKDFPKALYLMQTVTIAFYVTTAVVIYYFAGDMVKSPALNSANPEMMKVAWGIAMPSIVIAGVINGAVAIKKLYFLCWQDIKRNVNVTTEKSFRAYGSWIVINAVFWALAWLIAELIPSFKLLLAVVSALFMGFFSYGFSSLFWYHMNRRNMFVSWRKICFFVLNTFILIVGLMICSVGLWATMKKLLEGGGGDIFSCRDSSQVEVQEH